MTMTDHPLLMPVDDEGLIYLEAYALYRDGYEQSLGKRPVLQERPGQLKHDFTAVAWEPFEAERGGVLVEIGLKVPFMNTHIKVRMDIGHLGIPVDKGMPVTVKGDDSESA